MFSFTEKALIKINQFADLEDLEFIRKSFEKLVVDHPLKIEEFSAHSICRAFSKFLSMKTQSGYFVPGIEHSWLVTQFGNIIDVYPYGIVGGPILVFKEMKKDLFYKKARIRNNIVNKKQINFLLKQLEKNN
jgi:hypothetical protein